MIGSIAAALQVKFGYDASTAVNKAEAALNAEGIIMPVASMGLVISGEQISNILKALGFTVLDISVITPANLAAHFINGGLGLGYFSGTPNHNVFLTGYKPSTNTYTYYDSVTGQQQTGRPNSILLFFN